VTLANEQTPKTDKNGGNVADSDFYRGFLPSKGKVPLAKFKDTGELPTLEEASRHPSYVGVLRTDTVLVDIDDPSSAEIVMMAIEALQVNCRSYVTDRGAHFLFKRSVRIKGAATGVMLACGIGADIKVGPNGLECLKLDDQERFCQWDEEEGKTPDTLPLWLSPLQGERGDADFVGMSDGGRNSLLHSHILRLSKSQIIRDDGKEVMRIINNHILGEALPEDELEHLMRDEEWDTSQSFFTKGRLNHDAMAKHLVEKYRLVVSDGDLHYWDGAGYRECRGETAGKMIYDTCPILTKKMRDEVLAAILLTAPVQELDEKLDLISFRNGILDLTTGRLQHNSPGIFVTNRIPWDFVWDAYDQNVDEVLDKITCNDKQLRALIEETIGYSFYRSNRYPSIFILIGEGSNGKSVFIDMVRNVLGPENVSSLIPTEMGSRFAPYEMFRKLANIGDDIPSDRISAKQLAILKNVTSGNRIQADRKYQRAISFVPYCSLFFSCNTLPAILEGGEAVRRRLNIIPFNARFSKDDPDFDPNIIDKVTSPSAAHYLIRLGVEGLWRLLISKKFTEVESVETAKAEYEVEQDSSIAYVRAKGDSICGRTVRDVERDYHQFCHDMRFEPVAVRELSKAIRHELGLVTKSKRDGTGFCRIYTTGG
jgi:putative DNA primase/helicase